MAGRIYKGLPAGSKQYAQHVAINEQLRAEKSKGEVATTRNIGVSDDYRSSRRNHAAILSSNLDARARRAQRVNTLEAMR